jgi:transcriptional regulator with XRE-family HTH domain
LPFLRNSSIKETISRIWGERKGYSGLRASVKAGIAEVTLSRIERNVADPHMSTIRKLARELDVHPRDLVGD